jgi:hypothetical protein
MKLTYYYLLEQTAEKEFQATSLLQLISTVAWPDDSPERKNALLHDFVEHNALYSTLHKRPFDGFAYAAQNVLGIYITKITAVTNGNTITHFTQYHASRQVELAAAPQGAPFDESL